MYNRYVIRPLDHALSTEYPKLHQHYGFGSWPSKNFKIKQHSIQKRWGYAQVRDLEAEVQQIILFTMKNGSRFTVYLTDEDACLYQDGTNETFSYITDTYDTGVVTNISGAVVTGSGTSWDTSGLAAGDKFILDTDLSANQEPDSNWATIQSVDSATQITLTANYTGTTGAMSETYRGRKIYSVPTDERWSYAIVADKLCFGNGNVPVQYYAGSGYADALDATNANKARYMIEYADRLVIADYGSTRDPVGIAWSKNGDPTDWTDSTAGSAQLQQTKDFITGLGKVGGYLIVYKEDSIVIGNRTGQSEAPIEFPIYKPGIGLVAPYSIIEALGTNFFIGREDFYMISGNQAVPFDTKGRMREKFFDIVGKTEIKKVFGFHNAFSDELMWMANTSEGKLTFAYDYKRDEWNVYSFADSIFCGGRGII